MKRHGSMNHIYRLVWSQVANTWVAVAETARGRGKGSRRKLVAAALSLTAFAAHAGPTGGQVTAGAGTISHSGSTTTINQASQNLSLNWATFNIAAQESVNFLQPSASSVAVNRIFDTNGSQILGQLNANGQVFLINPNGILFGQGAQVNVGGLVASTLDLNDASLNGATRSFGGNGTGSVINQGTITATGGGNGGGYVALLGNHVGNQGTITAQLGTVALGAGSAATLTFNGNSLVQMQVDQSVLNSLAENGGLIRADGGQVFMSAGARNTLLASVVNNTGVIEARTVESHDGTITLLGGMAAGAVNVGGTLDASAPDGGNGGFIETSAASVKVASNATITTAAKSGLTGTWLIDPQDYTVAASGGDITGATLSGNLGTTSVVLQSSNGANTGSGNVNISDAVSWSANTTLTLTASNNVNVNANITATGNTAGLVINPNTANGSETASGSGIYNLGKGASITLSGATPSLSIAGVSYTVINILGAAADAAAAPAAPSLQGMAASTNLAGNFALGSNIDATATSAWNGGAGFKPIGNGAAPFTGTFDGLGHTITNLTINLPVTSDVGLFGEIGAGGIIRNLGLAGGSVSGGSYVGGLAGANYGTVSNSYNTGSVSGISGVGGLVGWNQLSITGSFAASNVDGSSYVGGLVGMNYGTISRSYATGSVMGASYVGGLAGANASNGAISQSYATGNVIGQSAPASSDAPTGGLVGQNYGTISNSYATGNVTGSNFVGGLAGQENSASATINNSFAAGGVTSATANVGGLVGANAGGATNAGVTNSFWDTTSSGIATSAGGTGMTTAQMQQQANFNSATTANGNLNPGWDFAATWTIYNGYTYPLLQSFMTPLTVTANNAAETYNGVGFSGGNGLTYSVTPDSNLLGTVSYGGTSQGAKNVGNYTITPGGLYSDQQGYIITYASGTLTINPALLTVLTVTGEIADNKTYDGTATAVLSGGSLSGLIASEPVSLIQSGTFASTNVGNNIAVTATDRLSGTNASNYTLVEPTGLTANITPAALTVTGETAANKVYNGTTAASLSGGALSGVIGGDSVTLTQAGSFTSKNAGTAVGVTVGDAIGGASAGNYTLVEPTGVSANITPATLTVTGETAANKVYNGTTADSLSGGTLSGVVSGDSVTLTQAGTFASKNVGSGIAVAAADTLSGANAGNYTLVEPTGLSANITPATLTVVGDPVAGNKVYDGTTTATESGGILSGVIAGDTVSLNQAGTFASKNAGTNIGVTGTDTISGASASNYTLVQPSAVQANITPATLTVTGETAANKVYNDNTTAILSGGSIKGVVAGDTVTLTQTGNFASKNVGTGIAVTATDTIGGTSAGNYKLVEPTGLFANITPAILTVTGEIALSKTYDSTTTATLTGGTLVGVLGTDSVTLNESGYFVSPYMGRNIAVIATDTLSGAGAGNYTLIQTTGLTANIWCGGW